MSKRFIHARWGGVFLGLVFGAQGALAQKPECPVSQSWVTNPSPAPITTSDPTNFCGFYQFAIQEYLYLTSPSGGGLVFETFPSLSDLFPGTDTTCADTDTRLVSKFHPNGKRRFFTPAHIKPSDPVHGNLDVGTNPVNGHTQAGSGGVLVDQTKQITYYEQSFNQTFSSFVNACDLTNVECVSAAPSSLRLPAGALEMKTAWRPISQTDPAFTTYYVVPNVTVVVNPDTKQCQTVPYIALVGMHLVFTTPNHPEAIWATFEHVDNAPNGPCSSSMNTQPPSGFKGWAYFDNTSPVNCSQVNQWIKGQQPPYPVSQVVMNYPYGDDNTDSRNIPTIHPTFRRSRS